MERPVLIDPSTVLVRGALSPAVCDRAIALFNADPDRAPGITGFGPSAAKSSIDLCPEPVGPWEEVLSAIDRACDAALEQALEFQDWSFPLLARGLTLRATRPQFQFYAGGLGDGYDWHVDSVPGDSRVLSCIAYLNTVTEGGETAFLRGASVLPEQGAVLLFPPYWTHVHCGRPAPQQDKYILTWFLEGAVRPSPPRHDG